MFWRQANIPRKGQGLAFQAPMEGRTGTHEEIIADQITDAMNSAVGLRRRVDLSFGSVMFPDLGIRRRLRLTGPTGPTRFVPVRSGRRWFRRPASSAWAANAGTSRPSGGRQPPLLEG